MTDWTPDELRALGTASELRIAGTRADGTLRTPVIIWGVRVGDELHVRSVYGPTGGWYRGTRGTHEGWIASGGVEKDVLFEDVDPADPINDRIDAAYREKYGSGAPVVHITSDTAKQAALRVLPR